MKERLSSRQPSSFLLPLNPDMFFSYERTRIYTFHKGSKTLTYSQKLSQKLSRKRQNSHIFGLKWAKTLKLYAILHENSHKLYTGEHFFLHPDSLPYLCSCNQHDAGCRRLFFEY